MPRRRGMCTLLPPPLRHYNPLQPSLRPTVQQITHLKPRPIRVQTGRRPLAIPRPLLLQLRFQLVFQHLHDVLAQYGEEFVAVEGAAGRDVKTLCAGVWGDDEVGGGCECVPNVGLVPLERKESQ
jgi:hypothetical protein